MATLRAPGLAAARGTGARLDPRSPASRAYLRALAARQDALARRIERTLPDARVRWRYRLVLDGLAVVLPAAQLPRLARLPGVARVYRSSRYRVRLDRSPRQIGADRLWGPDLASSGQGMKIAILDDGIDQTHPFFDPAGYTMPAGFPLGERAYTTAKVIVARAFPPPGSTWKYAARPFDPEQSVHGTHVAGIAAGDDGTRATTDLGTTATVSGVAPRAYLGNYKVLTTPTASGLGIDGNAAEIAAGIEAAVADGMDVINLSLGEPEVTPERDLVVQAVAGATRLGVVVAAAAGNDFDLVGYGSIGSPGTAPDAITAAAVDRASVVAGFSSAGPDPVSLALKPDVSAPGTGILSSVPRRERTWASFNGTSMASPHVAGAAALLLQRHPTWTPAQVKSALVTTGDQVWTGAVQRREATPDRGGGGLVDLPRADAPLLFAEPADLSFGLLGAGATATRSVALTDAGGGAGDWTVRVDRLAGSAVVTAPAAATVPGTLELTARGGSDEAPTSGFVVLGRGADSRRIPFWLSVAVTQLAPPTRTLARTGTYAGDTRRGRAGASGYRYPAGGSGFATSLRGPEQVFRVHLARPAANLGVAVLDHARGVRVEPRVVAAGSDDRLTGFAALPLTLNPYLASFSQVRLVAGAVLPAAGDYDLVFDTPTGATPGPYGFRFWVGDTTPPRVTPLARAVGPGQPLRLAASDSGAGVDPQTVQAWVDGAASDVSYSPVTGVVSVPTLELRAGRHRVVVQVSDYQELKNMEEVSAVLPNTRRVSLTLTVRAR